LRVDAGALDTVCVVPKRTNVFQEVVAIIHEHMAGDAVVEESGMLKHRVTGEDREVDVVIRASVAGHDVVVSVEATAAGRKADVKWVEQLVKKHEGLPTSKLVLVSQAGFTDAARRQAEAEDAVPLSAEDLSEGDPAFVVVNALPSLWPKQVTLKADKAMLLVRRPDGTLVRVKDVENDLELFLADGRPIGSMVDVFRALSEQNMPTVIEGIAGISENTDTSFTLGSGSPWLVEVDGDEVNVYVSWEGTDPRELHQIERGEFTGKATIRISEMPLHHKRLGEVTYAYGEAALGEQRVLFVVSESEAGGKATFRLRPVPESN
jgi:hypothetical protein